MTLTAELNDPDSPASRFLRDHFPQKSAIAAAWSDQARRLPAVITELAAGDRAAVGGAIEWCIGLDLADRVPYADVLSMVRRDDAERLLQDAGLQPPVTEGRSTDRGFTAWTRPKSWTPTSPAPGLLRGGWLLCQYASLLRHIEDPDPVVWREAYRSWLDTIGGPGFFPDVARALETLWQTYVTAGRLPLTRMGSPRVIRPVFDEAFAIGDLVLGGTLIDVKTYLDPATEMDSFVDQLLGYLLFDLENRFEIRSVGLYLAWQGATLAMPVDEMLSLATDQPSMDLSQARAAFHEQIAPAIEKSRFYKYGPSHSTTMTAAKTDPTGSP